MSKHSCDLKGCDGTRLGHSLAEDFPAETARIDDAFDRLAHPEDYLMPPTDEQARSPKGGVDRATYVSPTGRGSRTA